METIQEIINTTNWTSVYIRTKHVFFAINILLLAAILFVFPFSFKLARPRFSRRFKVRRSGVIAIRHKEYVARWENIIKKAESAPPHSLTFGVIEADSFVDGILKDLGFKGEHMADRLEQLDARVLASLDNLWKAHRTRNQIVHTPGYEIPAGEAHRHLGHYADFLKEIGVLGENDKIDPGAVFGISEDKTDLPFTPAEF